MAEEVVKLLGAWPSPFSYRVIWALELKGIQYEYIEEDLSKKSDLLLQTNPIHKKIPVLIHGRKPICESMIILQYIEETWPQCPLLPTHPHHKAMARFWINFAEDKGICIWTLFRSTGEAQEKAKKETIEMLKTLEEHGLGSKKFFGGDKISLVDLAFGGIAHWFGVIEQVVGVKLLEPQQFPRLTEWVKDFKQVSVIKQNLPNHDDMFIFFKGIREALLASP